jgi:hypothetical protein
LYFSILKGNIMADLGTKGSELNLLVRQGATQGPYYMTLKTQGATTLPIDITGAIFRAQIRKSADSAPLDGVTFTFTITSAIAGEVTWEIPATSTAALVCSEVDELQDESKYVWDMEVEFTTGRVMPLTYGTVSVFREISKVG